MQAKRLQRNDVLSVRYKVGSSGKQQRDLLINRAGKDGMKPVYCIYCTEAQRRVWKQGVATAPFGTLQAGCLLADARDVPLTTKRLHEIEVAVLSLALSLQSIRVRAAEDDTCRRGRDGVGQPGGRTW